VLVRLQKHLAEAGLGSRRGCETLIESGRVTVNGVPVTQLGTKVDAATDRVAVDGQPVACERKIYIALHKPPGYLCTSRDTEGRRRVFDLLPATLPRLFTVGRLDADSEGLLLLTNDGSFGLRLTHPRYKMPKQYRVEVAGQMGPAQCAELCAGIVSEGERLRAERVLSCRSCGEMTELLLELQEGKKRQIRRMCDALGFPVRRLVRCQIGKMELGKLKPGQWRYLTNEEVQSLQCR
jgi:pseudouridine synthase